MQLYRLLYQVRKRYFYDGGSWVKIWTCVYIIQPRLKTHRFRGPGGGVRGGGVVTFVKERQGGTERQRETDSQGGKQETRRRESERETETDRQRQTDR